MRSCGIQKRMWVGTKGKGLYIIDMANYKEIAHYTNVESDINSLSNNTIFSICKDTKNRVWVGTFGGGINLTEETAKGLKFKHFSSMMETEAIFVISIRIVKVKYGLPAAMELFSSIRRNA